MKYIEQRVEELEKEVNLLKAKNKLNDTSRYLNNYKSYNNPNDKDYIYNPSVNLMSEPDLETSFGHFWDSSDLEKNPLDTVTVNLSSIVEDSIQNPNYLDSFYNPSDLPEYCPPYPNFISSWNDSIKSEDVINETNEYEFKSNYDKMDKDFLEWLSKNNKKPKLNTNLENKIEEKYGEIICTFPIHRHEWEMDGYGYIVENKNGRDIILTDHGNPYISNIKELESLIVSYKNIIQKTERAIFLLK
jgi:hypothetical protein